MSVVEQLGADQVLEEAALLAGLLQVLEVGVEVQGIVGVAPVVVGREAGEEELERIGETRIRSLAFFESEPVDRGVDVSLVDAIAGESLEGIQDDLLHLLGVFGRDILEAGAENA